MKTNGFSRKQFFKYVVATAAAMGLLLSSVSVVSARPDVPPGKVSTPVYDYRDFGGSAVTQRVYDVTEGVAFYKITDTVSRPVLGELEIDREWRNGDALIRRSVMHFEVTDVELLWDWAESYNSDNQLSATSRFEPPLSVRQTEMPEGAMLGGGAMNTGTPEDNVENVTRVNTPLGVDDIHVPYGNLTGCLRMFEEHNNSSRISWYCPGVGLAKRLWGAPYDRVWQLSTCEGCANP